MTCMRADVARARITYARAIIPLALDLPWRRSVSRGMPIRAAACLAIICSLSSRAYADYAQAGPEATTTSDLPASAGSLVVPNGAGPYPLLVASHGWASTSKNQLGWAQHFASYGFVVVVPSFPSPYFPNQKKDEAIIASLVATYSHPPPSSPAAGKVDATRIGLEGHSAGGLATAVASVQSSPGATVLFDPVDNGGAGVAAVAHMCTPLLVIYANPSSCNNNEAWDATHTVSLGEQVQCHVIGASHCDGENAANPVCGATCDGVPTAAHQNVFASYATAYFLAHLKGDAAAQAMLAPAAMTADNRIFGAVTATGSSCAHTSSGDGSSSGSSAGSTSGGGSSGASSGTSSGSSSGATSGSSSGATSGDGSSSGTSASSSSGAGGRNPSSGSSPESTPPVPPATAKGCSSSPTSFALITASALIFAMRRRRRS